MKKVIVLFIILTTSTVVYPSTAHAYIDPGSGSYLFQVLLAAIFGTGFVFRSKLANFITMVREKFFRKNHNTKDADKS